MIIKKSQNYAREPNIAGFTCNWEAYSGVEMAGVDSMAYPACVRLVRVMCLGRLHLGLILKAFELGADGVVLLGCPPENCHYESGMNSARETVRQAKKILSLLGIEPERLALVEVPVGGGDTVSRRLAAFVERIRNAGPSLVSGRVLERKS